MGVIQLYVPINTYVDFYSLDEKTQKSVRQKAIKTLESEIKEYKKKCIEKVK